MSAAGVETLQRGGAHSAALTLIAMCVVGVSVFWWKRPDDSAAPGATATLSASPSAVNRNPLSRAEDSPPAESLAAAPPAAPARHDPNAEPHETIPARPVEFPVYDPATSPEVRSGPAESTDVDPATARAADIREAGQQGGGAAQLAQLIEALRSDELARNRLLAVNGLRQLAADPALRAQVLEALRAAQSDRDVNVARNARDACAELAGL